MPTHLIFGEDRFARLEAVSRLRASLDSDGSLANNSVSFEGQRLSLAELAAAASAAPFLGDTRWVRVDGLLGRFDAGGGRRGLGEWTALDDLLQQIPPSTVLVFVDDQLRRNNPLRQLIEPHVELQEFARLKPEQALDWLRDEVKLRNLRLTRNAAQALVQRTGGDRGGLTQALDKLELYAGEEQIGEELVELMAPATRSVTIFNLVDAVAEGRLATAMQALDGVRAAGEPDQRIMQMLARQYRQIIITREVLDQGGRDEQIQAALKTNFTWLARRMRRQAQVYSQASADAALARILEADTAIIDYRRGEGGLPEAVAVELLVAELAGAGVAAGPARRR